MRCGDRTSPGKRRFRLVAGGAVALAGLMGLMLGSAGFGQQAEHAAASAAGNHDQAILPATGEHQASGGYSHSDFAKKLKKEGQEQKTPEPVRLTPEMVRLTDIRTATVEYRHLIREIQTVGEIAYDERRVKLVSAWIGGRIDRLHVDFTGIEVRKGQPLADIYSPELVSTQQEFLLALETRARIWSLGNQEALKSASGLVEATRRRLLLWGISKEQIDRIERTREANTHMTIHAPIGGTVIHKQAQEGQYVKMGDRLYTIGDLSVVWALADVYEYELGWVKPGQKVSVTTTAYPGKEFTGRVSFIDPFLDPKTRSLKVRMDVPNKGLILKPGMFVDARLNISPEDMKPTLAIPYTAVLDTGVRKLAYIQLEAGVFQPVEIRVGARAGGYVPVLAGLRQGESVAVSANYLIDSQRALGAAATSGYGGAIGGHSGH